MKLLLTGASGLLGREVKQVFSDSGWDVTGLCFSRPTEGLVQHDITDQEATAELLKTTKPDLVIHAAAQRFPDKMESDFEKSWDLNVAATANLAKMTKAAGGAGGRLMYISTDYVFDGNCSPYTADSTTNPTNKYGQSKLEGEHKVREIDESFVVLRIPVLYGSIANLKESALTCLLDTVRDKKPAQISSYEVRCPAHTHDIAKILLDMANKTNIKGGVYQWSGLEKLSKWDVVKIIATELGCDIGHLEEVKGASTGAPRPRDVEMDRSKLTDIGISHHSAFKPAFIQAIQPFMQADLPDVSPGREGRILCGAPMKVPELSDKHQEIVDYAFSQLALGECPRKLVRVENFTSQVVAGVSYAFDLVLANSGDETVERTCRIKVWEKAWENFKQVTIVDQDDCHEKFKLITDTECQIQLITDTD